MNRNRIADLIEIGIKGYAAGGLLNKDAYLDIADKIIAEEGKGLKMPFEDWQYEQPQQPKEEGKDCPQCKELKGKIAVLMGERPNMILELTQLREQVKQHYGVGYKPCKQPEQPKAKEGKVDDDLFWNGLPEGAANQALVLIARLKERVDKLSKIQPQQPKLREEENKG